MINIGCKYIETKSMLIDKLTNPDNIEVLVVENISTKHACYFCGKKIRDNDKMFEIIHRYLNSMNRVDEATYFIDEYCMREIRDRNK